MEIFQFRHPPLEKLTVKITITRLRKIIRETVRKQVDLIKEEKLTRRETNRVQDVSLFIRENFKDLVYKAALRHQLDQNTLYWNIRDTPFNDIHKNPSWWPIELILEEEIMKRFKKKATPQIAFRGMMWAIASTMRQMSVDGITPKKLRRSGELEEYQAEADAKHPRER